MNIQEATMLALQGKLFESEQKELNNLTKSIEDDREELDDLKNTKHDPSDEVELNKSISDKQQRINQLKDKEHLTEDESEDRVEISLGKEKRYVKKGSDLENQLNAIKREITHLEPWISQLTISENEEVTVSLKCDGMSEGSFNFSSIEIAFDTNLFGRIKETYIKGGTYITDEFVRLINNIKEISK